VNTAAKILVSIEYAKFNGTWNHVEAYQNIHYSMEEVESIFIIYFQDKIYNQWTNQPTNQGSQQASKQLTQDVYFRSEQVDVPRFLQPFSRLTLSLGSVTGILDYSWGLRLRPRVSRLISGPRHENYRVVTFLNRMLRRTRKHRAKEQSGERTHFHGKEFQNLNSGPGTRKEWYTSNSHILVTVIKSLLIDICHCHLVGI
jgi:hypothetical protein